MTFKDSKLERYLHGFFELGLFMKAFNGIWETIVGLLILISHGTIFSRLLTFLARGELLKDSQTRIFAITYILIHGILNIFLAFQLYRNRLWAYKITIASMIIFISYQIYRIYLRHSGFLTVLTIFDIVFVILTWHEYKHKKALNQ